MEKHKDLLNFTSCACRTSLPCSYNSLIIFEVGSQFVIIQTQLEKKNYFLLLLLFVYFGLVAP